MNAEIELVRRTPPLTLFHYASHDGALGIMDSREVWATHFAYLNDQQELHHALSKLRRLLSDHQRPANNGPLSELLDHLMRGLNTIAETNIGVFSLSANPDVLSQWRAYCPRGVGYSIGFDTAELISAVTVDNAQLGACIYNDDDQDILLREVIDKTLSPFTRSLDEDRADPPALIHEHTVRFVRRAARVASYIKHPTFAEEAEWRLVTRFVAEVSSLWGFRSGRVSMIPHLRLPAAADGKHVRLNAAVVGPSPERDLALRAAWIFFGRYGLQASSITSSVVPFRSW